MRLTAIHYLGRVTLAAALCGLPAVATAQTRPAPPPPPAPVGFEVFGGAGFGFAAANESIDAVDLNTAGFEFGGGARVSGLWSKVFIQGTLHRWSDSGERAFVDSSGEVFPLGIPLDVKATFVDGTVGWRDEIRNSRGRLSYLPYVGGGAGVVQYEESSPFAQQGDNIDETKVSFHALAGVEVPLAPRLAVAFEGRYRYVPDLFGDGGVSGELDENAFGGIQIAVAFRVGFGGPRYLIPPPKPQTPPANETLTPERTARADAGVMVQTAPVYLLPDATRVPLKTLSSGEGVRILEEKGDWVRIEFRDAQFGPRVGWVLRKFVRSLQ